jgi:hypothetical protein
VGGRPEQARAAGYTEPVKISVDERIVSDDEDSMFLHELGVCPRSKIEAAAAAFDQMDLTHGTLPPNAADEALLPATMIASAPARIALLTELTAPGTPNQIASKAAQLVWAVPTSRTILLQIVGTVIDKVGATHTSPRSRTPAPPRSHATLGTLVFSPTACTLVARETLTFQLTDHQYP